MEDRADDPALQAAVHPDENVFEGGHVLEEPDVLEGAADPTLGDRVRRPPRQVFTGEDDLALRGLVHARDHVEERRLAGAVGADEANDRPLRDHEVDVRHGDEAAELLAHADRFEDVGHQAGSGFSTYTGESCDSTS
jgi:hypothetical protein